jgi:hypothetical protein
MKCFNHHDVDALGQCKCCGKGLCVNCLTDLGDGLACKGKHEEIVKQITQLVSTNTKLTKNYSGVIFNLVCGLLFFIYGIIDKMSFIMLLGLVFIILGVVGGYTVYKSKSHLKS